MPAVKFNGQAIEVAKLINLMKEEPVATKYLNAAIESNPASSIAVALREQDGGRWNARVKFNGQAIEVDTLIKHMAAEITLSKLNTPGYFETECGETLRLGASYTLGPCGITQQDKYFQFGISKTGQGYYMNQGVGDVNGEFSVCLVRGCTFKDGEQVDILGENNRRVSVPLDPSKLRLEVVEDNTDNYKIVMTYEEKDSPLELASKSVSKDELENYSIGVSYDINDRSGKTAHITEERFTDKRKEEARAATKKLNAAIESNPASSIAIALKTQKGNYQFSTGAGGMPVVKFNGQAIEVDTLIKHMAAEITLSKLNTPGYFETECGETLRRGASYTLGPCGITQQDKYFQFGISKTGQGYYMNQGVGDVNGEFSVCLVRGCTFKDGEQVDILGENNRRVSVPLDPSKLRLEVVEDNTDNYKIVMTYEEKDSPLELASKIVSKDELENYSIGVSYDINDRSGKTAHITEERFTDKRKEEARAATKKLNAAIESNPASSIAIALKTQKGNYQFSTGAGGMPVVKFNGQAIEVATLIKQMAAEIPLSKLEGEGNFKTERGGTLSPGVSYTLGPCGIITGDEAFGLEFPRQVKGMQTVMV